MVKYKLHTGKYSVISPNFSKSLSEEFEVFSGDFKQALLDIQKRELQENKLFSGHFVIFNSDEFKHNLQTLVNLNKLSNRNIFVESVVHTGVDKECTIDSNVIFCSSWVLPIVLNTYRTANTLYGNCIARRIKINKLQTHSIL